MTELKVNEMKQIIGGGISGWGILGLGTLFSFLAGIIDGIARPFKCN